MKGRIELPTLFLVVALGSAGFFGIIMAQQHISNSVEYHMGDYSIIANTKLRADGYERRMQQETRFNSNNASLNILEDERDWNPGEVPEFEEEFKMPFIEKILGKLKTQNYVSRSHTPQLDKLVAADDDQGFSANLETGENYVRRGNDKASATVYTSETIEIEHKKNEFLKITKDSVEIGKKASEIISGKGWDKKTKTGTSSCQVDTQTATSTAYSEAKGKIPDGRINEDIAAKAVDEASTHDSLEHLSETEYTYEFKSTNSTSTCELTDEKPGVEATSTVTKYPSRMSLEVEIKDPEDKVLNHEGEEKRLNLTFKMTEDSILTEEDV